MSANCSMHNADGLSIRTDTTELLVQTSEATAGTTSTVPLTTSPSKAREPPRPTSSTSQSSSGRQGKPSSEPSPTGQVAAPTASDKGTAPASSSSNKVPIIVGVVIGVVVAAIGIWLLWRCLRKRTSAAKEARKQANEKWGATPNRSTSGHGLGVYESMYPP